MAIDLEMNLLYHILARGQASRSCNGTPTDADRVEVPLTVVEEWFRMTARTIDNTPAHFVLNTDEMGNQRSCDRRSKLSTVQPNTIAILWLFLSLCQASAYCPSQNDRQGYTYRRDDGRKCDGPLPKEKSRRLINYQKRLSEIFMAESRGGDLSCVQGQSNRHRRTQSKMASRESMRLRTLPMNFFCRHENS
jgi:hypothetical protein